MSISWFFSTARPAPYNDQRASSQDILTTPGTVTRAITGGNFSGGRYYTAPDGRGAAFDADGVFHYFGVFTP